MDDNEIRVGLKAPVDYNHDAILRISTDALIDVGTGLLAFTHKDNGDVYVVPHSNIAYIRMSLKAAKELL